MKHLTIVVLVMAIVGFWLKLPTISAQDVSNPNQETKQLNQDIVSQQASGETNVSPKENMQSTDETELLLQKFIEKGKALFADPKLGNGEKSCLSCHTDPQKSLGGKIQTYPKYSKVAKTIVNQVQQINLCLTKPMKGQALSADDDRMTALIAFLVSLSQPNEPNK